MFFCYGLFFTMLITAAGFAVFIKYALVAQLDRVLDSDSKGRWFESSQARQKETKAFLRLLSPFLYSKILLMKQKA